MPLFEDEKWTVVPQMMPHARRGEDESHVGFMIEGTDANGNVVDIVTEHGMFSAERDLKIATLFAASNDLYNAAERIMPMLRDLEYGNLDIEYQDAIDAFERALRKASRPELDYSEKDEQDWAALPPGGRR